MNKLKLELFISILRSDWFLKKKNLRVNPTKRLSIEQIKKHPWFYIEKNKMYKGIDLTVETILMMKI